MTDTSSQGAAEPPPQQIRVESRSLQILTPLVLPGQRFPRGVLFWGALIGAGVSFIFLDNGFLDYMAPRLAAPISAHPLAASLVGLVAFAVATAIGALRHAYGTLMAAAIPIPGTDSTGRSVTVYMGTMPPRWWLSIWTRLASHLAVGVLSLTSAIVAVRALGGPADDVGSTHFAIFVGVLLARWFVSAAPGGWAARRAQDS